VIIFTGGGSDSDFLIPGIFRLLGSRSLFTLAAVKGNVLHLTATKSLA